MISLVHAAREEVDGSMSRVVELGLDYGLRPRGEPAARDGSQHGAELLEDGAGVQGTEAVVHYILGRHGKGRLSIDPADVSFGHCLNWLHFSSTVLVPAVRQLGQTLEETGFRTPSDLAEASRHLADAL